jgi:outer membrane protein OmpA-like peptidoglycan-associated protein
LIRLHKGDIATLYNVYFYNDAAVMLPESQYELNNLLAMMQEKPYNIVLHGHTNGNASGKIITMGPDKNFFSLSGDVKEGFGSSKELSRERAQTIKEWLVVNGIAADRIEIKGWGGGRMIHDKHSVNAKKNVRVDVEVVSE